MKVWKTSFILGLLSLSAVATKAAEIELAFTDYMKTGQFQRITEYFTGHERAGSRTLLRSNPEERSGLYFIIRLNESLESSAINEVEVEWIRSESGESKVHTFPIESRAGKGRWIYCGLTGDDWPDEKQVPLAWSIRLKQDQRELAQHRSFLYVLPDRSEL